MHIVSIGALGTLTFGWILFGRFFWLFACVSALDWFLVNLLNRVVDLAEDRHNRIVGTGFVEAHARALTTAGFVILVASLLVTFAMAPLLGVLRASFHTLGLVYNYPLLPGGRRIKQLYFFKNTASALGFLITVFGYPLVAARRFDLPYAVGVSLATVVTAGVFFFLFELSYEALYDLRDREGDLREGVRSYAVVHGEGGAMIVTAALLVASMLALAAGYAAGVVPWRLFVAIVAPALQLVLALRAYRRNAITSRFCIALTWLGAGILVVFHLWNWLGLPGT
jgi:4-hydroxybenzoate polyprenyltransferase